MATGNANGNQPFSGTRLQGATATLCIANTIAMIIKIVDDETLLAQFALHDTGYTKPVECKIEYLEGEETDESVPAFHYPAHQEPYYLNDFIRDDFGNHNRIRPIDDPVVTGSFVCSHV